MGAFAYWVVAKGPAKALRAVGLEPTDPSEAKGWRYGDADGVPDDLAALVSRVADSGPALGAAIFDSDEALVVAAAPGTEPAALADVDAFVAWADAYAPRTIDAGEVRALLARETTFVEEMLFALVDRLGLARAFDLRQLPDEADERFLGGSVWRPWNELRFVPGVGDGFIGIWDRERPGAAIEHFPLSRRGHADAEARLEELLMPVVLEAHGLDGFGGYESTVLGFDQLTPAYRAIEPADARFALGRGNAFIGIWDRERPEAAIERFPDTEDGWADATHRLDGLLYEWLAAGLRLPGERLFGRGELLVEEEPHPTWHPVLPTLGGRHLYRVFGPRALQHSGGGQAATSNLQPVPDDVPRTLLATGEWVAAQGRM